VHTQGNDRAFYRRGARRFELITGGEGGPAIPGRRAASVCGAARVRRGQRKSATLRARLPGLGPRASLGRAASGAQLAGPRRRGQVSLCGGTRVRAGALGAANQRDVALFLSVTLFDQL
jgi:hypothetical protein